MIKYGELKPVTQGFHLNIIDGNGAELYDDMGNTYLDLNEISTVLGQNNKHFQKRMTDKLYDVTTMKAGNSPEKKKFYQYLSDTTDHRFQYVHLTSSGSEASEWAVRMALKMTGRNEVLAFWNSIHGRTYLGASMSGMERRKQGYAPSAPGVLYGIYPDCRECPFERECKEGDYFCLRFLDRKMKYESSGEIGAVIVEAYQGSGIVIPPKGWLKALETWAHEHGALFILDEIQSGMGRTGSMYSFMEEGLDPDMILLGKALGNGIHVGAILTKEVPDARYLQALAGGAGDSELTYAAGCAVFEELLDHGLLDHIRDTGEYLKYRLMELKEKSAYIRSINIRGLAASVEMTDEEAYQMVLHKMKENRMLPGTSSGNRIVIRPPYSITKDQIDRMIAAMGTDLG